MDRLQRRIEELIREEVRLVTYDPSWPERFRQESDHLRSLDGTGLIQRIEHVGSTAVPGLFAKPIIDVLIGVHSLERARSEFIPVLEAKNYESFWRPSWTPEAHHYFWLIKRDGAGARAYHIHIVESDYEQWDMVLFRDQLRAQPELAREYAELKRLLASEHPHDRVAYTSGKKQFVTRVLAGTTRELHRGPDASHARFAT